MYRPRDQALNGEQGPSSYEKRLMELQQQLVDARELVNANSRLNAESTPTEMSKIAARYYTALIAVKQTKHYYFEPGIPGHYVNLLDAAIPMVDELQHKLIDANDLLAAKSALIAATADERDAARAALKTLIAMIEDEGLITDWYNSFVGTEANLEKIAARRDEMCALVKRAAQALHASAPDET